MSTDDQGNIEVAIVVSICALRRILRRLDVDGRKAWIASDPLDAEENGWVRVGWGQRDCIDPLNTVHFRIPLVDSSRDGMPDRCLLLFEASSIASEERGYLLTRGKYVEDDVGNFDAFFKTAKAELLSLLTERSSPREDDRR